ncbi:GNAT family N-acetyltransferase [Janthinobacterium sp. PSPC1-1]|uniref:GNAT family N-acetyltransferase n=1 Tax=Janthinobacterium sp. PSPC1-1 TaxID=2804581 RepID=UPI003CF09B50
MTATSPYTIRLAIPTIATYQHLRVAAGMSAKSTEAAAKGLPNSLFAVQVLLGNEVVGMGRIIGDGGCFFQVTDIAVLPAHQGKGLGKRIMGEIMQFIETDVPQSAYVSLIADGQAQELYAQFGFKHTAPVSVGMALVR